MCNGVNLLALNLFLQAKSHRTHLEMRTLFQLDVLGTESRILQDRGPLQTCLVSCAGAGHPQIATARSWAV